MKSVSRNGIWLAALLGGVAISSVAMAQVGPPPGFPPPPLPPGYPPPPPPVPVPPPPPVPVPPPPPMPVPPPPPVPVPPPPPAPVPVPPPAPGTTVVLDFEAFSPGTILGAVDEDGYRFTTQPSFMPFPQNFGIANSSGTNALIAPGIGAGDGGILRRQDGGIFSLTSVDMFTSGFGFEQPYNLFFNAIDQQGTQNPFTVMVPGFPMSTPVPNTRVNINFGSIGRAQNIVEFRWTNPASPRQYDNFVVTKVLGPGAVPEPGSWIMMILGFGAVGAAMRRKDKAAATA